MANDIDVDEKWERTGREAGARNLDGVRGRERTDARDDFEPVDGAERPGERASTEIFHWLDLARDPDTIPPRPWLLKGDLLRGVASGIIGPGGGGKSALSIAIAIAVATGDGSFLGMNVVGGPQRVLIINNEDDRDEISRRIAAACRLHEMDQKALSGRIAIYEKADAARFVAVARNPKTSALVETAELANMRSFIQRHEIALAVLDPFISIHHAGESNNPELDQVIGSLRTIARATNSAALIVHHARKPAGASSEGFAGNSDAARGGSGIRDALRSMWTFFPASEKDAQDYGLTDDQRLRFARLDTGKLNYQARTGARWFESHAIRVGSETAVALKPVELQKRERPKKETKAVETLRRAFAAAVKAGKGVPNPVYPDGDAVPLEIVRKEFTKTASRQQWYNAINDLPGDFINHHEILCERLPATPDDIFDFDFE